MPFFVYPRFKPIFSVPPNRAKFQNVHPPINKAEGFYTMRSYIIQQNIRTIFLVLSKISFFIKIERTMGKYLTIWVISNVSLMSLYRFLTEIYAADKLNISWFFLFFSFTHLLRPDSCSVFPRIIIRTLVWCISKPEFTLIFRKLNYVKFKFRGFIGIFRWLYFL